MEIKFRAWHKKHKKYYEVFAIKYHSGEVGLYGYCYVDFDDIILEQYTGINDKQGKEIYVGDIVKYTHEWEVDAVENEIAVVKFEDGGFSPMQLANGGTYYGLEGIPVYEVISNVHERGGKENV